MKTTDNVVIVQSNIYIIQSNIIQLTDINILAVLIITLHGSCLCNLNLPAVILKLQMEKLASRHAITELMSWISLMENIIEEDQDKIQAVVGSENVRDFLQKYKV